MGITSKTYCARHMGSKKLARNVLLTNTERLEQGGGRRKVNPPPELVGLEDWRVLSYEPPSIRPEARGLGGFIYFLFFGLPPQVPPITRGLK